MIEANDSIMCGCFSIGLIDFMFKVKGLLGWSSKMHKRKDYQNFLKWWVGVFLGHYLIIK